jgi:hypothetical protein
MADTAVAITAGTGTNIDTRTEATNGNHRQVVVLGDPSTNAGVAPVDATNGLSVNVTNASLTVASHAVTNAGTFATQVTSIAAGDNNIGNVDIVTRPALAAGTNNIGDVDVLSVVPGTAATSLGKAADSAAGSTDTGVSILAVRDDTLSSITPVEGDYAPARVNANGAVWTALDPASAGIIATGTAGTASATVLTVQGVAAMTPVATVGKSVTKTITMTADTAIMASADIIADTQQLDAAFRVTDGTGVLNSITVFDPDDNAAFAFDVYIHRTSTSMGTENAGITITDANAAAGIIGVVSFATTDAKDLINGRMYHKSNIGLVVSAVSGTDDLYFSIVNGSGTPTFAGGSIPMVVGILQD